MIMSGAMSMNMQIFYLISCANNRKFEATIRGQAYSLKDSSAGIRYNICLVNDRLELKSLLNSHGTPLKISKGYTAEIHVRAVEREGDMRTGFTQ